MAVFDRPAAKARARARLRHARAARHAEIAATRVEARGDARAARSFREQAARA